MVETRSDQAAGLRRIFGAARSHIVAVVGGNRGAGATTCTMNLAAALRRHGRTVLMVDSAARSVPKLDMLLKNHGGAAFDSTAGIVLVDTNADAQQASSLAWAAQQVIVVVSPGVSSITGGYAAIKSMSRAHGRKRFQLLVNRVDDDLVARRVQTNMVRVALERLDVSVEYLGAIPRDPALTASARRSLSVVDAAPGAAASRAFLERGADMLRRYVPQNDANPLDNFMQRAIYGCGVAAAHAGV